MWNTFVAKVHADCFSFREFEAVSVGPGFYFVEAPCITRSIEGIYFDL